MTRRSQATLLALPEASASRLGLRDRIYEACLAAIRDGRLAAGRRLPSARQLATDWSVARNTIDDALSQLHAEGVIVRRVGDGTFVAPGVNAPPRAAYSQHRKLAAIGKRALRMASARGAEAARPFAAGTVPRPVPFVAGLAALDAFPMETWRRLAARCWRASGTTLLGYLPASGYPPLQTAIAEHVAAARGIRCNAGQVMILNSAMQAHDLIARVLGERDDVAWIEDPCYPNLRAVLSMAGIRVVPCAVDAEGFAIESTAGERKAPVLICVTPSCQYPTGVVMSLAAAGCGAVAVMDRRGRPPGGVRVVGAAHGVHFLARSECPDSLRRNLQPHGIPLVAPRVRCSPGVAGRRIPGRAATAR
jgi:GntR family transcriptional regulator/MocR family aminotransferase